MPAFKLLDQLNTALLDINTPGGSGLGRYLPDRVVRLLALRPMASALQTRLSDARTAPVSMEFSSGDALEFGGPGDLALQAGASIDVGVHQADELLFPADDLRDAISVPGGTAYVSIAMTPQVAARLDGERGPLAFGFSAGGSVRFRFYQPFDVAGADPTLAEALAGTLEGAVLPGSLDDLATMPVGSYASVEGNGALRLSGGMELASMTNPLATPGLPVIGSASVTAGASVKVGAEWEARSAFEIRVAKVAGDRVRLSYYRRAGSEISIDATASVGVAATIGKSDAIRKFVSAVSADPEVDLEALINAGLDDRQIEALQKAVAASIDRSVRMAVGMQFSSVRHGEALFSFDIDLRALAAEERTAVEAALRGRLTAITEAAAREEGAIRVVHTGILSRRDRRVAWRINLFGILNVRSVAELLRKGTLSYDPETGTLNAADEISSQKILVRTRPFEADGAKVRKLVFESMIITAAYRASRLAATLTLGCSATYFEGRQRTTSRDVRDDYSAILALGLADEAEGRRRIGVETDFGPSTFLLECTFDQHATDALFLGPDGALSRDYYERVGRDALLALIPPGDAERAHRRAAVEGDASWAGLKAAGPAASRPELERRLGPVRAAHIVSDYLLISWWADAMHGAAKALLSMRRFLGGRSAAALAGDPQFAARRERLEKELAGAVKESRAQFGDPWGILALDAAAKGKATVLATIVSPRLTAMYNERLLPAVAPRAAKLPGSEGAGLLDGARAPKRPLTADEQEILRRHAVNLRLGAFSTDGEFHSEEADVRRLFTELLPAELEARRSGGQKLRLLFYAHGGLIGEREGLEPVLSRLKFWRQNNVYPVSFVWETGLRETITDILRGLRGAREMAARGIGEDLADAFLEAAARPAGKRAWGQMKRSAEVAVLEGGGAAFVAAQARDLWNAHHAEMEIHAVGHSAGAIFHSHFVPALLAQAPAAGVPPLQVKTLHLLAPACSTALFNATLKDRVGKGRGIDALTMYTMNKSLELADTAGPYKKSLLYLVSRAFEPEQPTRILGLEESVRQEAGLMRFFGLAGGEKSADLLFSKTPPDAPPRSRTTSVSHGGFDDDVATMSSVMRRVLDARDTEPIVDFFQEAVAEAAAAPVDAVAAVAASIERAGTAADVQLPPLPLSGPAAPQTLISGPGGRKALCIGIDRYGPPYDLEGCVNDARNWAAKLGRLGFEVTSLHDAAATRSAMLEALRGLVGSAGPGDVIVFQFAGHGTQVDDLDGDEDEDGHDEAFCPADFAAGRLLIDDDVRGVIAGMQAGVNLTCFIDCCHSGTITRALVPGGRPSLVPPDSRPRFIRYSREISARHRAFRESPEGRADTPVVTRALAQGGMKEICFSACQPHEVAYETAGAGQFTTRAMQVLESGVDLTHEGFMEAVVAGFGARPAQRPHLDCADDALGRRLLQPFGVGVGAGRS